MKPSSNNSSNKIARTKSELNKSISAFSLKNTNEVNNNVEFEMRIKKLETIISLLTNQNDILIKRIEDLESNLTKMQSVTNSINRSMMSTSPNTNNFEDQEENVFFSSNQSKSPEINAQEILEWKTDIEVSLEKISERVALNDCTNYLNFIEKKVNELESEFEEMKKLTRDFAEIQDSIRKNTEKCDKCEILVDEFIIQLSELKNSNIAWQTEYAKQNSDLTDKIMSHEFYIDQLQKFEKSITKKYECLNNEFKKKEQNNTADLIDKNMLAKIMKIDDISHKIPEFEEALKINKDACNNINKALKDEISKIDNNIKALWDSFALFSTSIHS